MIKIVSDWGSIDRELDRLMLLPGPKGTAILTGTLEGEFAAAVAAVHVETGSLKSSGKQFAEEHEGKWEGHIQFGGESEGVNNPVDYAIYEKARGGPHNFMAPVEAAGPIWVEAVKKTLEPGTE